MLATIRSNGARAAEYRIVEAWCRARLDVAGNPVQPGILGGDARGDRIDVGREHRDVRELRQRDGKHGAARAEVERIFRMLPAHDRLDHFEASGGRAVMAGAEGQPCLDLDGKVARPAPVRGHASRGRGSARRGPAAALRATWRPSRCRAVLLGRSRRRAPMHRPGRSRSRRSIPSTSSVGIKRHFLDAVRPRRGRRRRAAARLPRKPLPAPGKADRRRRCRWRREGASAARGAQPSAARRFSLASAASGIFLIGDGAGEGAVAVEQDDGRGVVHRVVAALEIDLARSRCRRPWPWRGPCPARR